MMSAQLHFRALQRVTTYQSTTKHEVLPDQDTHLIAGTKACLALTTECCRGKGGSLVQRLILVHTSSPHSKHILIAIDQQLHPGAVPLSRDL